MKRSTILSLLLTIALLLSVGSMQAWAAPLEPDVDELCPYVLLEDMDTDTVLYSRDSEERLYPASTTKLVTALVVLRHVEAGDLSLKDTVTCSSHVQEGMTSKAAKAGLQKGEKITIKNLLYLLMLPSHCDAGNALAEAVSGSVKAFAEEMNRTAEELGCTDTHFTNPHGLHNDEHYTTCADMYRLAKAAYEYETYRTIVSATEYTVPATNLHGERKIHNTNALLSKNTYGDTYLYKYCTGGKTGSTFQAKYCLVSYAEKGGRRLCCVMMHGDWYYNRDGSKLWMQFVESKRLYKWGFHTFREKLLVEGGTAASQITVENSAVEAPLSLITEEDLTALVDRDLTPEDITLTAELPQRLEAPVEKGQPVGTLHAYHGDTLLGSTALLAAEDVAAVPKILGRLDGLTHQPRRTGAYIAAVAVPAGVALLLLLRFRKKQEPDT